MAEVMDIQARDDISREMVRAKEAESTLGFALESLRQELEDLKARLENLSADETDDTPTRDSDNLITSGAVYDALMSLNKKVDALRS